MLIDLCSLSELVLDCPIFSVLLFNFNFPDIPYFTDMF